MGAWRGWYHLMANTYGTWLPGDPRGFRTRHHREHVEGDYRNPPPSGKYEGRYREARERLKREPVTLSARAREAAVVAIRHALVKVHEREVLAIAVGGVHLHLVGRFPAALKLKEPTFGKRGLRSSAVDDPPRHYLGIAKKESSKALSVAGLVAPGGVWARRGKVVPIRDREHQLNVVGYVLRHRAEGAVVWYFADPEDSRGGG